MFSAIILTPDTAASLTIQRLAIDSEQVTVSKILNQLPQPHELVWLLNTVSPELVFLDISDWDRVAPLADKVHSLSPETAIIGFGAGLREAEPDELMTAGVQTVLASPVTVNEFRDVVAKAVHNVQGAIQPNLVAFLPSKAGSGCTVTALNVAGRLAGALEQKVLLIESDLHSGILSTLTKCPSQFCLQDALEDSSFRNPSRWNGHIAKRYGIDLLPVDRSREQSLPDWNNYYHLLRYVGSEYERVLIDLPEVVNNATAEVVSRAEFVFIVCTPELLSLELARQRSEELCDRGVDRKRTAIVLNRWLSTDIPPGDVEQIVGHPVYAVLPNDYRTLRQAALEGGLVPAGTEVGEAYLSLARKLSGIPEEQPDSSNWLKSRFRLGNLIAKHRIA